jgi:hypothetical protein
VLTSTIAGKDHCIFNACDLVVSEVAFPAPH